jgi:hypothetical protein
MLLFSLSWMKLEADSNKRRQISTCIPSFASPTVDALLRHFFHLQQTTQNANRAASPSRHHQIFSRAPMEGAGEGDKGGGAGAQINDDGGARKGAAELQSNTVEVVSVTEEVKSVEEDGVVPPPQLACCSVPALVSHGHARRSWPASPRQRSGLRILFLLRAQPALLLLPRTAAADAFEERGGTLPHPLPSLLEVFSGTHSSKWEAECICLPLLDSV